MHSIDINRYYASKIYAITIELNSAMVVVVTGEEVVVGGCFSLFLFIYLFVLGGWFWRGIRLSSLLTHTNMVAAPALWERTLFLSFRARICFTRAAISGSTFSESKAWIARRIDSLPVVLNILWHAFQSYR